MKIEVNVCNKCQGESRNYANKKNCGNCGSLDTTQQITEIPCFLACDCDATCGCGHNVLEHPVIYKNLASGDAHGTCNLCKQCNGFAIVENNKLLDVLNKTGKQVAERHAAKLVRSIGLSHDERLSNNIAFERKNISLLRIPYVNKPE